MNKLYLTFTYENLKPY